MECFHPLFTVNSTIKLNVLGQESFAYNIWLIYNHITILSNSSSSNFHVFTVVAVLQCQYSFNLCQKLSLSDSSHHAGRKWDASLGLGEKNGTSMRAFSPSHFSVPGNPASLL